MRIVTSTNQGYLGRITPYLESLERNSQIPFTLVTVGFNLSDKYQTAQLDRSKNAGSPLETECTQHGSWLQAVDGTPDDLVIYTDGDIRLQRPFTKEELDFLTGIPDGALACGYNSGPTETLAVEGRRLFPRFPMEQIGRRFMGIETTPCYNIGVMAARRSTYQRIYDAYMPLWVLACDAFGHPARQQWLFCYVLGLIGIDVLVTPYSFHANGHYGMPPGCMYDESGILMYRSGSEPVMVAFRHKL